MKATRRVLVWSFVSSLLCLMAFPGVFVSKACAETGKKESAAPFVLEQGTGFKKDVDDKTKVRVEESYGRLPLYFIRNDGQVDDKVEYYERGRGHATFFTNDGVYISLVKGKALDTEGLRPVIASEAKQSSVMRNGIASPAVRNDSVKRTRLVRLTFLDAIEAPEIVAEDPLKGKVNYFIGSDPAKWRTSIPTFGAVLYKNIYEGVDVKFYGNNSQLEYDIIVRPGGDPERIKLSYEGIKALRVTDDGDLEIVLEDGKLIQKKPYVYQEIEGRRVEVEGSFVIEEAHSSSPRASRITSHDSRYTYSFKLASYDKNHPIVIDPVLVYSTYLGGSAFDLGLGLSVDSTGSVYVSGGTESIDFPVLNPIQGTNAGLSDAFVAKIDPTGTSLVYSTFLGGAGSDQAMDLYVDATGAVYLTGSTLSADFPTVSPIQGTCASCPTDEDGFVTKIDPSGSSIVYSTYLGGTGRDLSWWITEDSAGNVYVTGETASVDFPVLNALQNSNAGLRDGFVTKIDSAGTSIIFSTYLGGSGDDITWVIDVDAAGFAYVTGETFSTDFPVVSPLQGSCGGCPGASDGLIAKISPDGSALVYSTYIGGSDVDSAWGIVVDSNGAMYLTGLTASTDFPTVSPLQGTCAGCPTYTDGFVTKIDPTGTTLVYSTYLGGSDNDIGAFLAVDRAGNVYIRGITTSPDFPVVNPIQGTCASCPDFHDATVTKIDASGSSISFSTYLGGSNMEWGWGIALDENRNIYVAGYTYSTDFPLLNPMQGVNAGAYDVFITKISGWISIPRAWFSPVIALPGDVITFWTETTGAPTSVDVYYGSIFLMSLTDQGGGLWSGSYTLPANVAPGEYKKINIRATDGVDTFTWPWLRVE